MFHASECVMTEVANRRDTPGQRVGHPRPVRLERCCSWLRVATVSIMSDTLSRRLATPHARAAPVKR